ncbi:hypothetical protein BJX61DRAFT_512751 [Aspergillus egyptiacus]|nr:hypothetical protein BJX61DRAFT_512751 [Aspergillus egyptiacus]
MKFTFATFVTLVAAVAAMPQKSENNVKQQSKKQDIDALQAKCGDLEVNCCIDTGDKKSSVEAALNLELLPIFPDQNNICSPIHAQGLLGLDLGNLLGVKPETHVCDVPNAQYMCCSGKGGCKPVGK